jgi:uncharacterized protein (TIGR02145 family)
MQPMKAVTAGSFGLLLACSFAHHPDAVQQTADPSTVVQATVSDIDGNIYPVVEIGGQLWLAKNLQVMRGPTGEEIENFFFKDDSLSYADHGRLYTWNVAMNGSLASGAQGICPDDWHIPTNEDWTQLFGHVENSGALLLVGGSTGFDALLSGGADFRGNYLYFGELGMFWSSTEVNDERANHHHVSENGEVGEFAAMKGARISVRCVKSR